MQQKKLHILFKIATLFIVVALLFPLAIKSIFIFEDHHHDICVDDQQDSHLHEKDFHCEFYKFKVFTQFLVLKNNTEFLTNTFTSKNNRLHYNFLHIHRPLSQYLRGPPNLLNIHTSII